MFPGSQTHTTFMAYYNVSVESKTVKFDIIVHLRDSTFTPAAMQSPTTKIFSKKGPVRIPPVVVAVWLCQVISLGSPWSVAPISCYSIQHAQTPSLIATSLYG